MGHVGVGNLGDEAIIAAVVARLRERAPDARLVAFTLNPRDTSARHGIPAFPIRLYTERRLAEPPLDLSWPVAFAAKSRPAEEDADERRGIAGWVRRRPALKRLLRPAVLLARGAREVLAEAAFALRSWRRLRGVTLLVWAGSGQVSDYLGGWSGFPLTILRWTVLARLRGARVAFASAGAGPVTNPVSRAMLRVALRLAAYRAYRDPSSVEVGRSLGAPEPNLLVRDLALGNPLLNGATAPRTADRVLSIAINPLPYYGGEYWHVQDAGVYDAYLTAHAQLAADLLRRGHRVTLFPTNVRVDPRAIRLIVEKTRVLAPDVASRLELERSLQGVADLLARLLSSDLVVATRYHGVLLALACGTPVVAVAYHAKTREIARHLGVAAWCVEAEGVSGARLLERADDLIARLDDARAMLRSRWSGDLAALLDQFDRLAAMARPAGRSAPA
jgi:polysaccharide pyruvyl transferase WcaK-like protein